MIAYKLFRLRKNGTLAPLFINAKLTVPVGVWLESECHPTKGYAVRQGWHCCLTANAPHLSEKGRVWCAVEVEGVTFYNRPESQGGTWILAERMRVKKVLDNNQLV